jgi:uncharacterized protein (DUF2267 family)
MAPGLHLFDTTIQESNLWLKDLMARLGTKDGHAAQGILRATLHALRDRIGPENATHLGAQLPMLLRGLYYEGWRLSKSTKERHTLQFIEHVRSMLPDLDEAQVRLGICAVLDLLAARIDPAEAGKLAAVFPKEMRNLWPEGVREAAASKPRRRAS